MFLTQGGLFPRSTGLVGPIALITKSFWIEIGETGVATHRESPLLLMRRHLATPFISTRPPSQGGSTTGKFTDLSYAIRPPGITKRECVLNEVLDLRAHRFFQIWHYRPVAECMFAQGNCPIVGIYGVLERALT